jgi:hypothetical protein
MPPAADDPLWWEDFESQIDDPEPEPGDFWPEEDRLDDLATARVDRLTVPTDHNIALLRR